MKNVDVSIVIVNYNARNFLRECVQSIFLAVSQAVSYEVIIVDNASTDESTHMVTKEFDDKVTLIASKKNVGFSKGNNLGIKKARGRYLLFLNPDTIVRQNTLEVMVDFMDKTLQAGAATCFVRLADGTLDDGAHRGFPTPWNAFCYFSGLAKLFPHSQFFNGYNLGFKDLKKTHEIDALVGAFMFVRREAGDEVAWWDEDFFFYGEDLDFCYKLREKGWKIFFLPNVDILHYKGVSGGIKKHSEAISTADRETKTRATNERFKAMKLFYKKHYVVKYPPVVTWLVFWAIDMKLRMSLRKLT